MRHFCHLAIIVISAALVACGSDDSDRQPATAGEPATTSANTASAPAADWGSEPLSLFSDSLHDIPMPEPGWSRVEIYGGVFEGQHLVDCSAPTEPPPHVNDWDDHRFSVSFSIQMGERYSNISVSRAIKPEIEGQTRSGPVEMESIAIRTLNRGGQTQDLRNYALRRNQPDQPPRVSRAHDERPAPPESADDVPGIRVHPDGRRATFVGQIGRSEEVEESDYQDFEEVRIAVYCGPV